MEFLGIGYQEVLLVLVLMLIVVGPERMPQAAYQIGRAVREMQKYARAVRDEFRDEFDYLEEQAREVRGEMQSAGRDMDEIRRSLRTETQQIDRDLKDATAEVNVAIEADKNGAGTANGKALPAGRASTGSLSQSPKPKPATSTRPKAGEPGPEESSEGKEPEPDKPPLVF